MKLTNKIIRLFLILMLAFGATAAQTVYQQRDCINCHKRVNAKKFVHEPSELNCLRCHQSTGKKHPSDEEEGFKLAEPMPQLCYSCHKMTNTPQHMHSPVKDGDCLACHQAHSSNEAHLTSLAPPKQCYFCHTDLRDKVSKAAVVHGAMNVEVSCINCHDPHGSSQKKILVAEETRVCYSCHYKPIVTQSRTIGNMQLLIESSKYQHGAIENNGCAVCHNPHATNLPNLLVAAYPSGNYAPGQDKNYNECFASCHESTMITEANTKETGFRSGTRNLHFVHVAQSKGRTCNNCHSVHASNNLFLLADNVSFGSWQMPLRFRRIEKGGSCAPGCHSERSYVR